MGFEIMMETGQLEGCILWIGFGMRPDLTGKGLGESFVNSCTSFAIQQARNRFHYQGEYIGLGVYLFNQRAIKVYERAGYIKFMDSSSFIGGKEFPAQSMKK